MIFSGSCVIDYLNTSGLGSENSPPMVAIFTYHKMENEKAGMIDYQNQGIAFSLDKGRSWTKYSKNPVLKNPGIRDFRDPKVSWHEASKQWIMILAVQDHVAFYGSKNLTEWNHLNDFGIDAGDHGGVWECPDLFELPVEGSEEKHWVMLLSINPGAINGGSGTQYFIGQFDGQHFTAYDKKTRWLDYGKDNYAGVTWNNIPSSDNRRIFLGWMSNWQYANRVPTEAWRSAMTIPRELTLRKINDMLYLCSQPVKEIEQLHKSKSVEENFLPLGDSVSKTLNLSSLAEINFTIERTSTQSDFVVELKNDIGEYLHIRFDGEKNQFILNRDHAGKNDFSAEFGGNHLGYRASTDLNIPMSLFLDVSSLELFTDNGSLVMTEIFFPTVPFNQLLVHAPEGDVKINLTNKHILKKIW
jgi:fructan beta-fructosidase